MNFRTSSRSHGFTLIELLVVIAIIGILSAVVLASLTGARTRGNDAAIKSNLNTIRVQAELYYGTAGNNSYGTAVTGALGSCATAGSMWAADNTIESAVAAATSTYSGAERTNYVCASQSQSYMFITKTSTNFWCIDNTGIIRAVSALPAAGTYACPAS